MALGRITVAFLAIILSLARCDYPISVIQPTDAIDATTWQCLSTVTKGALLPLYLINRTDPALEQNIQGIKRADFDSIEGYVILLPALPEFASIDKILSAIKNATQSLNFTLKSIVLSVSDSGERWFDDPASNMEYLVKFVEAAKAAGYTVGIYSSAESWYSIMRSEWNDKLQQLNVWYDGDSSRSFDDWSEREFGMFDGPYTKSIQNLPTCDLSFMVMSWRPTA